MKPLFARLSSETAHTYDLVLRSAGIAGQIVPYQSQCAILVPAQDRSRAVKAISLYLSENPVQTDNGRFQKLSGQNSWSALFIVPILALIHWAVMPGYEHQVFVERLGADAALILSGDLYRCTTALLLHKDWPHVVNNMVGAALFGTVAASACGWGVGWLMTLFSGILGNLLTALWYRQDHLAIGASTAVFGALGICVALNLWRYIRKKDYTWRTWLPLAGGLALLGLLGGSPHSDLMAHLAGFVCGLALGAMYGVCRPRQPWGAVVQSVAAVAGVGTIALSWGWGVIAGG